MRYTKNSIKKLQEYKDTTVVRPQKPDLTKYIHNGLEIYASGSVPDFVKNNLQEYFKRITQTIERMGIDSKYFNLFYENYTTATAFNKNGSLFLNVKYFNLKEENDSFFWRWFIIICHELAHNTYVNHDSHFLFIFQEILREYLLVFQTKKLN
tara:strand:- start:748 stop:1206 length:459 start_codon:yes stop_codon:yes gene_type:complete